MKILNADQLREADAYTIAHEPIASVDLMERAALHANDAIVEYAREWHTEPRKPLFRICCGPGNNGGDGLAIARHLHRAGFSVSVWLLREENLSPDCAINLQRLREYEVPVLGYETSDWQECVADEILVDALFGTGLNRPLEGTALDFIQQINAAKNPVISIDMPSGLRTEDNSGNTSAGIIRASVTLTFQTPKLSFFFPENHFYTGHWQVLDIGLHREFLDRTDTPYLYVSSSFAAAQLQPRSPFSHKGTYGHALLLAGSKGKAGAAVLATRACLRSGAGLVTAAVPDCAYAILQTTAPEAMALTGLGEDLLETLPPVENYEAIGIGPGIGTELETGRLLKLLIQQTHSPLVLDADALNLLAENKTWLSFLPEGSILTPHPGEFARLFGKTSDGYEQLELLRESAFRYRCYIVLKGAYTRIATPDRKVYFNSTGNPGMATGGSGDVLTGLITGLRAQGYGAETAAVLGVYLHGLAGDLAASEKGMESLIASDIIEYTGAAFRKLNR